MFGFWFVNERTLRRSVGFRIGRHSFFMQAVSSKTADEIVDYSEGRYTDEHTYKTKHSAKEGYGEYHPECGQTGGIAEDLRANHVAVQLLQSEDEDGEVQSKRYFPTV